MPINSLIKRSLPICYKLRREQNPVSVHICSHFAFPSREQNKLGLNPTLLHPT